jgi:hypothetical protein
MWPNAKIGVMGAEQAASVLAQVEKVSVQLYSLIQFNTLKPLFYCALSDRASTVVQMLELQ